MPVTFDDVMIVDEAEYAGWDEAKRFLGRLYDGRPCRMCGETDYRVNMKRPDPAEQNSFDPNIPVNSNGVVLPLVIVFCTTCGVIDAFESYSFTKWIRNDGAAPAGEP